MSGRKILDCTPNIVIKAGEMPRNYLIQVIKMTEEKYTIHKYKRILFYVVILVLFAAFF